MKISLIVRYICFGLLFILLGVVGASFYPFSLSKPDTIADVVYAHYGCGDLCLQTNIIAVSEYSLWQGHPAPKMVDKNSRKFWDENRSPIRFIGWDVFVSYKGDDGVIEDYLSTHFNVNGQCRQPIFRLTGQFKRRLIYSLMFIFPGHTDNDYYDGIYFDAKSVVVLGDSSSECGQPKEAAL